MPDIHFQILGPEHWKAEVMLVPFCEGEVEPARHSELDRAVPWLAVAPALRDLRGEKDELALVHGHPELSVPRVLTVGLGPRNAMEMDIFRRAIAEAVSLCVKKEFSSILLPEPLLAGLPGGRERLVEEAVCAALLALRRFSALKKKPEQPDKDLKWIALGFTGDNPDYLQAAARRGENAADAVGMVRELANTPGNLLSPQAIAERAQQLAGEYGFACTVFDETELEKQGFGALVAVGRGSARPPRRVVLEHVPEGCGQEKPLVFVGKGITFDSGGLCIKSAAGMREMKSDMSGAAAVLAVVAVAARENVPRRLIGLLACAENMPDGRAMRPGDVVRAVNGDMVEIANTDAEGRLVLCDALSWAQKEWTPTAIIDIATLTGACAVALGRGVAGLFCDDAELAERIRAAGGSCGEPCWELPLWKPYAEHLKSEIADICNMGPREGGAILAALFLRHFVAESTRWAHLDIAGTDWAEKSSALCPKGATGFGTRTLLELARRGVL
ncbi:MAG: leucyl aminopeptidase [Desulfovibrio sp.]|jgi:leucyl aminopeptidase|nr:leucyl aminopeptidase [Desulfovibrio sp.]